MHEPKTLRESLRETFGEPLIEESIETNVCERCGKMLGFNGECEACDLTEKAPPGWEKTVKKMKKHSEIDNPFALAWSMHKKSDKSKKR